MKLKSLAETHKFTPTEHISFSFGTIQFVENYFSKLELYSLLSDLKKKGVDLAKQAKTLVTYKTRIFAHLTHQTYEKFKCFVRLCAEFSVKLFHPNSLLTN